MTTTHFDVVDACCCKIVPSEILQSKSFFSQVLLVTVTIVRHMSLGNVNEKKKSKYFQQLFKTTLQVVT